MRSIARSTRVILGLVGSACASGPDPGVTAEEQQALDIAAYEALAASLEVGRTEALGEEADELRTAGDMVFWLEFAAWDPTLHSRDTLTGQEVDYQVPLSGDAWNYVGNATAIATARRDGDKVTYLLYQTGKADAPLGQVTLEAPKDEQKWWAYALDAASLYLVRTGEKTELLRYVAGAELAVVHVLEDLGVEVGVFEEFGVEGDRMVFIESGRLWELDLATGKAAWFGNQTEIGGSQVFFGDEGVLYTEAGGPRFYRYASQETIDLEAKLEASSYELSATFAAAHEYASDAVLHGDHVIYIAQQGVYAARLDGDAVAPILLTPRTPGIYVTYRYPATTAAGKLFVTGLTSQSGAIGADGPVYQVDLGGRLP